MSFSKDLISYAPSVSGVYRMLNKDKLPLYIGKAKNLAKRLAQYLPIVRLKAEQPRLATMLSLVEYVEFTVTVDEVSALLLERELIRKHKPRYNVLLKDDKSFYYITVDTPDTVAGTIALRRTKTRLIVGKDCFGPFIKYSTARYLVDALKSMFLLRSCSDSFLKRTNSPCLEYYIKRCSAICVAKITHTEYSKNLEQARQVLEGKFSEVTAYMKKLMHEASLNEQFELAVVLRDRLKALENLEVNCRENVDIFVLYSYDKQKYILAWLSIRNHINLGMQHKIFDLVDEIEELVSAVCMQVYVYSDIPNKIVIFTQLPIVLETLKQVLQTHIFVVNDDKDLQEPKQLTMMLLAYAKNKLQAVNDIVHKLELLANYLQLSSINRIESYDNSHWQGKSGASAMVVVDEGGFNRNEMRRFYVKKQEGYNDSDDYFMLEQTLTRRFKHTWPLPEVLLIDGGIGHVNRAAFITEQFKLQIKILGIAKGADRKSDHLFIYDGFQPQPVEDIHENEVVWNFLKLIRDKTHQLAISTHTAKRNKDFLAEMD